jgi:hypothetical protein
MPSSAIADRGLRTVSPGIKLGAVLLLVSAAAGVAIVARWFLSGDTPNLTFAAQDTIGMVLGLSFLGVSAWSGRGGWTRALLFWAGALLYLGYFWLFHVDAHFDALLPAHVVIVSLGLYGALYPVVGVDPKALKARFALRVSPQTIALMILGTSAVITVAWLVLLVGRAQAGGSLNQTLRLVVAFDGLVLLPLMGGLWFWRRQPAGVVLAGLLLIKSAATFLTLAVTGLVAWSDGGLVVELAAYGAGLAIASLLLFKCLASLEDTTVTGRPS